MQDIIYQNLFLTENEKEEEEEKEKEEKTTMEINLVDKNFRTKQISGPDSFICEFYQTLKEEISISQTLLDN